MSMFNLRKSSSSEDQHFLQNLGGHNDIFQEYCKVQTHSDKGMNQNIVKEQMNDQPYTFVKPDQTDNKDKGSCKEKKKVFYRDKLACLMKPGELIKQEYNYVNLPPTEQLKSPISKEEQLKRNRESAKHSRQRKKEYISFLEKKNEEQMKVIAELTQKLELVTLQRDRLKQDNHAQFKNFSKNKAKAFQHLQNALKDTKNTQEDIDRIIEDILQKFGASGSQRIGLINYYMNEIIEDLVSDIHKYFLVSSTFVPNFMPSSNPKSIDLDVMRILRLDAPKLSSIMIRFKERFVKQTTVFKDLTQELYRIFKSILTQGKVIELVFAELKKQIDPKALAQLIVWFQQNRFYREVKRVRSQWNEQLKTGEEVIEVFRKHIKQEAY